MHVDDLLSEAYCTLKTASPKTSILGSIPKPGLEDAANLPFFLCGAPSAVLTVT